MGFGVVDRKDLGRKLMNIRAAYRRVGTETADWVPYFKSDGYVAVGGPDAQTSLYVHPGRDALLIVANFNGAPRTLSIDLDLAKLGLAGKALRASNALTRLAVEASPNGRLTVPVVGKSFVLVHVAGGPETTASPE